MTKIADWLAIAWFGMLIIAVFANIFGEIGGSKPTIVPYFMTSVTFCAFIIFGLADLVRPTLLARATGGIVRRWPRWFGAVESWAGLFGIYYYLARVVVPHIVAGITGEDLFFVVFGPMGMLLLLEWLTRRRPAQRP